MGFVMPRYYDVFVPADRRTDGCVETVVNEVKDVEGLPALVEVSSPSASGDDGNEAGIKEK